MSSQDNLTNLSKLTHRLLALSPAKKILEDGEKHIKLLEKSDLNWTVLRSPIMNDKGNAKEYLLTGIRPMPWKTINRYSVAIAMIEILKSGEYSKQAPYIVRN